MRMKLSLTLNFGEEDEPLLTFLSKFPKDQWESILKDALQAYREHSNFEEILPEKKQENISQGSWNLDDLFVSPSSAASKTMTDTFSGPRNEDDDKPSKSLEDMPNSTAHNPLGHLFELIGQEEDEEVLEFFLQSKAQSQYEARENDDSVSKEKENLKAKEAGSLPQGDEVKATTFKGLDFLLSQVIGEEDDPEVLDFFNRTNERG